MNVSLDSHASKVSVIGHGKTDSGSGEMIGLTSAGLMKPPRAQSGSGLSVIVFWFWVQAQRAASNMMKVFFICPGLKFKPGSLNKNPGH